MAGTLVYSPAVSILIHTQKYGTIDVSDDIISGDLTLNQDAPHNLSFRLENVRRKYDGVFMPNDRVVVRLKRIRWLQVFAGYLNSVPFASVWPRAVDISATCTLKRLIYTFYDPGSIEATNLMGKFSTNSAVRAAVATQPGTQSADGNLAERAQAMLTEIVKWEGDKIHIGRLPPDWWTKVQALYEKISPQLAAATASVVQSGASIYGAQHSAGVAGAIINNSDADPSIMGPATLTPPEIAAWWNSKHGGTKPVNGVDPQRIAKWYIEIGNSEGVRGDLALAQAIHETGYFHDPTGRWARQNNPAGIAVSHDNSPGASFSSPQDGILAQIQLLKRYAMGNDVKLNNPEVGLRAGASATTLSGLQGTWATATDYFSKVSNIYTSMLSFNNKSTRGAASTVTTSKPIDWFGHTSPGQANADRQGGGGSGAATTNGKSQYVFPVPGGNNSHNFGKHREWPWPHTHAGTDIGAPADTPILAAIGGTVQVGHDPGGAGNYVRIVADNGDVFVYMHMGHKGSSDTGIMVQDGEKVATGQQIGRVGDTGDPKPGAYHLHFEYHPAELVAQFGMGSKSVSNPDPILQSAVEGTPFVAGSGLGTQPMLGSSMFPKPDEVSSLLIGPRMLLNDTPVFGSIKELIGASMRSFCSAPNGDFIAWFPDYFGQYGLTATMTIEEIELLDFTIDWDDTRLITHQFVTGSTGGFQSTIPEDPGDTLALMTETMGVASLDFPEILEAIIGENAGDWTNPRALLQRFGARPDLTNYPAIVSGQAEFFMAVHLFKASWARQFTANVPISFMPELYPGMIAKIPSQGLQVYVEQVRHSWNFAQGGGFDTRIQISSPASLDGRFASLPQANNFGSGGSRS